MWFLCFHFSLSGCPIAAAEKASRKAGGDPVAAAEAAAVAVARGEAYVAPVERGSPGPNTTTSNTTDRMLR